MDSKTVHSTIDAPPGVPGVSKNQNVFLQIKLLSSCNKIDPKKAQIVKIEEKKCQKTLFLRLFQIFFNFGATLVHQTSYGVFSGSWRIF